MAKINEIALKRIEQAAREEADELDLRGLGLHELPEEIRQLKNLRHLRLGYNSRKFYYLITYNFLTELPEWLRELRQLQSLDLSSTKLTELPEWLGQLRQLQSLDLSSTNLTELPERLGQLRQLQSLDLSSTKLTELPEWLGQLRQLQSLYLRRTKLTALPEWLGQLRQLQSLYLSRTKLTELPEWLGQLRQLQSLDLSFNKLTELPEWLRELTQLNSLYLRSTNLTALPEWLGQLRQLQSLDLSSNKLTALPEWLGQLRQLQSLDLRSTNLTELPEWLGQLRQLQSLDLSSTKLTALPEWLGQLRQLQSLDLRSNNLTALPEWLGQLRQLQSLDLSRNKLTALPEWLGQLGQLQSLYLRSNNLTALPEWLGQLRQLQSLDLGSNKLTELPEWLGQLRQLQSLDLGSTKLTALPEWLGQLRQLQSLYLGSNKLTALPEWLGQLRQLQSLDLSANNLSELPEWLEQLTQLQSLDLSANKLTALPEWLVQLTQLQSLNLRSNKLTELPEWLGQLTQLQSLYLSANNLTALPEWLEQLTQLQSLDLSANNLTALPEWLEQLTQLQSLDLSANNLTALPEWLVQLTQLQSLNLSFNKLPELPGWLGQLKHLGRLQCYGNPVIMPPPEVLGEALKRQFSTVDLDGFRRYFAQLQAAKTVTFYEAKLLIVGEGGAGKTSLACKLQDDQSLLPEKQDSTEGIDIVTWHFPLPSACEEEQYRVNIWDFGGQEVYFATHQFFLTHRSVYVLVADTRQQHTDFYTWLRLQETFGGSSPILLLKNRNRRKGSRFFIENLPQLRQRFPNLKDVIELDLESVPHDDKWQTLVRDLQHRFLSLDHVGVPRPAIWVAVREALRQDSRDTISLKQYLAICAQQKIEREDDALQLSDYLHHLGDILHFQDDPVLADLVILKPTWGLDAVYRVLDNETIVGNWGKFSRADLRNLWDDDKYDAHHHQLLRLMENFQLCYPLADDPDSFIAPQLLRPDVPDYNWDHENNLQLRYRYPEFMPRGIFSRAAVKLHHRIEKQTLVWRSGVILNDGYARAELLELRGENEIRIRVSGRNMRDLLMEIVRALDELHLGFPKLRYEKLIPCNCTTCRTLQEPHFYDLQELLDRLANRKETKECNKSPYEDVSIRSLLDDAAPQLLLKTDDRFNIYGDLHIGDRYGGDHNSVGEIKDSNTIAIGHEASARTNPPKS